MSVGTRLREERQRLGYKSQDDFAKVAGVVRVTQNYYELDKRSPDNDYWQAAAKVGMDIQYVITGKRGMLHVPQFEVFVVEQLFNHSTLMLKEAKKTISLLEHSLSLIEQLRSNNHGNPL